LGGVILRYIDTHSHTYLKRFNDDREELYLEISENFDYIIDVGIDKDSIDKILDNVKKISVMMMFLIWKKR
jgi:Tat protein secretion system quality control protein TatD with DNase activity